MKLTKRTVEAIIDAAVSDDEIREIGIQMAAENQFQVYVAHLRQLIAGIVEWIEGVGYIRGQAADDHVPNYRMQLRYMKLEEELRQYLKQCLHWTRRPDGTCCICEAEHET